MTDIDTQAGPDSTTPRPKHLGELFWVFNRLSLQGFGGVLPVAQRELVERCGWLTPAEFLELLSLGQVLPGPNVVNMALVLGDRYFGLRGAACALTGMLLVPLILVLGLAALYAQWSSIPAVAGAVRGMAAVSAGLVLSTGLKLAPPLRRNPLGWGLCAVWACLTVIAAVVGHWPLAAIVLGLGGTAVGLVWWRGKA